jgi:hypothetical protein
VSVRNLLSIGKLGHRRGVAELEDGGQLRLELLAGGDRLVGVPLKRRGKP